MNQSSFTRKPTIPVMVGNIGIGGNNPVRVQSMTNTPTADITATVAQIAELAEAGSELVRITVNDDEAAKAVPLIVAELHARGIFVPIIGDFHFNGHILLNKYPQMAQSLAKLRINPGNVGSGERHDENFKSIIDCVIKYNKPVRIGANGGSIDKDLLLKNMERNAQTNAPKASQEVFIETLVESALASAQKAQQYGLAKDKIILSVKMSDVRDMVQAYRLLAAQTDLPLHLGLTEA